MALGGPRGLSMVDEMVFCRGPSRAVDNHRGLSNLAPRRRQPTSRLRGGIPAAEKKLGQAFCGSVGSDRSVGLNRVAPIQRQRRLAFPGTVAYWLLPLPVLCYLLFILLYGLLQAAGGAVAPDDSVVLESAGRGNEVLSWGCPPPPGWSTKWPWPAGVLDKVDKIDKVDRMGGQD